MTKGVSFDVRHEVGQQVLAHERPRRSSGLRGAQRALQERPVEGHVAPRQKPLVEDVGKGVVVRSAAGVVVDWGLKGGEAGGGDVVEPLVEFAFQLAALGLERCLQFLYGVSRRVKRRGWCQDISEIFSHKSSRCISRTLTD